MFEASGGGTAVGTPSPNKRFGSNQIVASGSAARSSGTR
jgi:hypothetical protein